MWRQRALECFFLLCRIVMSYGVMVAFLAAPPVIVFNQQLSMGLQRVIKIPALMVEQTSTSMMRQYGTSEALELVWLGHSPKMSFTAAERQHLLDVHALFVWASFVFGCAVIVSILIEKEVIQERVRKDVKRFVIGMAVLSVLIVVGFPWFFDLFHYTFFPQGNYSFSPDSLIIQCFPTYFWLLNALWLQTGMMVLVWWQAHHAQLLDI